MTRTTLIGLGVATVVAVGMGCIALVRSGIFQRGDPVRSAMLEEARARYAEVALRRLDALDTATISDAVAAAMPTAADDPRRSALGMLVSEFVRHRLVQADPGAYIKWRRSLGYELVPKDEFIADWKFGNVYQASMGGPIPADATMESLFRTFWTVPGKVFGASALAESISAEPRGVSVAEGVMNIRTLHSRPRLAGWLGQPAWYGINGATMRNWFRPPVPLLKLADPQGNFEAAEVGLLVEYADGVRRPLVLTCGWDKAGHRWILLFICQYNVPLNGQVDALEY